MLKVLKNSMCLLLANFSLATAQEHPAERFDIDTNDVWINSRGGAIPATFVAPVDAGQRPIPYVLMAHGHGASRDEGGGFAEVATLLARRGIASIRIDFPGCGDSRESFRLNNLTNMLLDLKAAREYVLSQPGIDDAAAGLLGFSMGGRLTTLLAAEQRDFKTMVLWSPAVQNGASREAADFGGDDAYAALRALAEREGFAPFTTSWGKALELAPQWFDDLESTRPLDALQAFQGALLVVYGSDDVVVPPATSRAAIGAAINSSKVRSRTIDGGTHDLGFYSEHPEHRAQVVASTVAFFIAEL